MRNSVSQNIKSRGEQAKRSKGPAERSATFGVLLLLGFLNLAAVWQLSLWFLFTARAFYNYKHQRGGETKERKGGREGRKRVYSRRCRCYGEDALLLPRSHGTSLLYHWDLYSLGAFGPRCINPVETYTS